MAIQFIGFGRICAWNSASQTAKKSSVFIYLGCGVKPQTATTWPEPAEARWRVWGRSVFALVVVVFLAGLGVANIVTHAKWHEVEDGVFWGRARRRSHGRRGCRRIGRQPAPESSAATCCSPSTAPRFETQADVIEYQHTARAGTRLTYTLARLGTQQVIEVALAAAPQGSSMYYVLAAVGLFTLLVGASVRLKRPHDQATLHFFWLCVAFFGAFTFSFNGPFDRLDWVFYWGDAVAQALLPPLLLHFTLVFPQRPAGVTRRMSAALVPLMYLPALVLGAARVIALTRGAVQRRAVFDRHRNARSAGAGVFVLVRDRGARRARARLSADDVGHGATSASLDCVGHGARRRSVRLRLCAALGARHRSAAGAAVDGDSSRLRAADVCVRDRPLPASRRRGHRQARARLHRVRGGDRGAWAWRS